MDPRCQQLGLTASQCLEVTTRTDSGRVLEALAAVVIVLLIAWVWIAIAKRR